MGGRVTSLRVGGGEEFLSIPAPYAIAAMISLGRPNKQLTKLRRKGVEEFTMVDRWGGPPLEP